MIALKGKEGEAPSNQGAPATPPVKEMIQIKGGGGSKTGTDEDCKEKRGRARKEGHASTENYMVAQKEGESEEGGKGKETPQIRREGGGDYSLPLPWGTKAKENEGRKGKVR